MRYLLTPTGAPLTRRGFLKSAAAASTFAILPARGATNDAAAAAEPVLPSGQKVNLACIGIGGQGGSIANTLAGTGLANVVALCDVDMDSKATEAVRKLFPKAPRFQDFRKMFDKMAGQIDAVSIGVPDHSHFPIAMLAMSLGKHVYVEKPLAHTFHEVDLLMAAEKKYKVAAQMGNQGHSGGNYFQFQSWVEAGLIKGVTRVDAFMNGKRRWHDWKVNGYPPGEPLPKTLDWDVWHGTAEVHPFNKLYHPGNWRGWFVYGNGAFGDWGPHILDTIHEFLHLGLPEEIAALKRESPNDCIFPLATTVRFQFPARGDEPPVAVTWYDGQKNRPTPPPEAKGMTIPSAGKFIYAKDHVFLGGSHSDIVRIIPDEKMKEMAASVPKVVGKHSNHYANFLLACQGVETCRSNFAVAGPLTQVFMLGVIAQRLGGTLSFDRMTRRITNNKVADALLEGPPPRKGWEPYYKL